MSCEILKLLKFSFTGIYSAEILIISAFFIFLQNICSGGFCMIHRIHFLKGQFYDISIKPEIKIEGLMDSDDQMKIILTNEILSKNAISSIDPDKENPKRSLTTIMDYLETNYNQIGANMKIMDSAREDGFRALKELDRTFLYSHLIDIKGIPVDRTVLSKNIVLYFMLSCFLITKSQNSFLKIDGSGLKKIKKKILLNINSNIIPCSENLFPNSKSPDLSTKLKDFFHEIFTKLVIFFNISDIKNNQVLIDIAPITKNLSNEEKKRDEYSFVSRCSFCQSNCYNSFSELKYSERLKNKYSQSAMIYTIKSGNPYDLQTPEAVEINEEFVHKFNEIKIIGVLNQKVLINEPNLISSLKYLTCIRFENNGLESLPESLFELDLNIENLSLSSDGLNEKLTLPEDINSLSFSSMLFDDLPFDFDNCKLSIQKLSFSAIEWFNVNEYRTLNFAQLVFKLGFYLDIGKITKLMAYFDHSKSDQLNKEEILKLNAFIFKKFVRLGEKYSELGGIPQVIFEMKNLTSLDLSYQALKFVPGEIAELKSLSSLTLKNCILLESLSSKLGYLPIKDLDLNGCLSLKTPPPEIVRRGTNSVMSYLKRLLSGTEICKRTKLMLVGLGEAGKTSLMNALISSSRSRRPQLTDGIDIKDWSIDLPDSTGQSVYYNSHQFFLTSRAVYFLVWNVRLGSEYAGLDFWLSSISCHAPGAPIFVIGTHIDEVPKFSINQEKLKSRYNQICGFYFVSNTKNIGIDELVKDLIDVTLKQKYMNEAIPTIKKMTKTTKCSDKGFVKFSTKEQNKVLKLILRMQNGATFKVASTLKVC
ncbi:serine threonine- kinase pats1 [Brachionus plicatilis]|uniref:Serine threonine-kinase pats1 n=1 Tax=Brachionus plicatilis TaxID=10195 RepID=A0A3M7PG36_BRAPC|nr:serine threonine- kinase pats1 [Brachionus plicatilis]